MAIILGRPGGGGGTFGTDATARSQATAAQTAVAALEQSDVVSAVVDTTTPGSEVLVLTRTDGSTQDVDVSALASGGTAAQTTFDNVVSAMAGNPTNVQGAIDAIDADIDSLNAAATAQDAAIAAKADAVDLTAEETTRAAADAAQDTVIALKADKTELHDAVTLAATSDAALTLSGQELDLTLPAAETKDAAPTDASTNAVESNGVFDALALKVNIAEKATLADIGAKTADKWLDAASVSDTDDLSGTNEIVRTDKAKPYVDGRDPFLSIFGWVKQGGQIVEEGTRRFTIRAISLTRWDQANHAAQSFTYAEKSVANFQYYDRNGIVATGFDGSDVSGPQDQVQQAVGFDDGGTLASITARSADNNDGANYRVYVIPQTGDIAVLLPQVVVNNTNNAFYRMEDETNQLVLPAALSDAVLLGVMTLDENANNFTYSISAGPLGSLAGQASAASGSTFAYVGDVAARDALTSAEMAEGGIVGVGDDGNGVYAEYRVLTLGADWGTSTTEKVHPSPVLTQPQATATGGIEYTEAGLATAERLDQWGQSRRVDRIFDSGPLFDYDALGYAEKTAIFIRNTDNANGINVDAGAGVTIDVTLSDGTKQSVVQTANIQPGEIGVFERDGITARLNIFPGERVKRFPTYAAANGFGALPHDGLVLITDAQEIWARKTNVNGISFPADGVENADWGIYGAGDFVQQGTTAERDALGIVPNNTYWWNTTTGQGNKYGTSTDVFTVTKAATDLPAIVDFAGVNSVFSAMQFKITTNLSDTVDNPTITLPDGQDTLLYIIGQQFFNGSVAANTLGGGFTVRNDGGVLTLVSVEPNRHWGPSLDWNTIPYTSLPNIVAGGINITLADVNAIFANVPGTGEWLNLDNTTIQPAIENWDQKAYEIGDRVFSPMPINADFITNDGAEAGVVYIFEANTARPDTVTAFDDTEADSGFWDLIGTYRVSGTDSRVIDSSGIMALDPLVSLGNADRSEFIHWTVVNQPLTVRLLPAPAFVTTWIDYSGNDIAQPVAANSDFVIPAGVQMWVHRVGNSISVVFEPSEGGSDGAAINDQAASGYMDIGTMRLQWGVGAIANAGTQIFSQPFGNTPVVTATTTQQAGHNLSVLSSSATQFTWDQWDVNNTQQSGAWNWIAIGLKP